MKFIFLFLRGQPKTRKSDGAVFQWDGARRHFVSVERLVSGAAPSLSLVGRTHGTVVDGRGQKKRRALHSDETRNHFSTVQETISHSTALVLVSRSTFSNCSYSLGNW